MNKRTKKKQVKNQNAIRTQVKEILNDELCGVLNDVRYRIESLYTAVANSHGFREKFNARDLNLASHQMDGFTVTDNSPTAGSIAWTDCNIIYKGANYAITNGNTATKYVWRQFSATDKTKFQMTDTKPTLTDDDVLVFINDGGTHSTVIGSGGMVHGATIIGATISGAEVKASTIGTGNIAADAITGALIAPDAVGSSHIADGAVVAAAIGTGAVGSDAIASNAVNSAKIAAGAVGSSQIASSAVTPTALAANAVTSAAIASGAVSTDKLNAAMHMLF